MSGNHFVDVIDQR